MGKKSSRSPKGKRVLVLLAAACLFLTALALSVWGTEPGTPLPGLLVGPESGTLLLLAEGEAGPYIVCAQSGGASATALDTATEDAVQITLGYPLLGAAFQGGYTLAFAEEAGFPRVTVLTDDLETLRDETLTQYLLEEIYLYTGTPQGGFYAVLHEDRNTLCFYDADGGEWSRTFDSPIRLLHITENSQLWVCTENGYYAGDAEYPERLRKIEGGVPQRIIGSHTFMDAEGSLWRVTGESAEPLLKGLPPEALCAADDSGVVYADSAGRIHKLLWGGGEQGTCTTAGEPLALTAKGALYRQDGSYYYALLDFTSPEPSPPTSSLPLEPSLAPTPSPQPTPSPAPEWLDVRPGYLYITGQVPVEQLLDSPEFMAPQEVYLEAPSGEPITSGSLATGMLACWTRDGTEWQEARIVVWGDCDGSGRLDKADMEQAQLLLLQGRDSADEWFFLAADRDEDGEITAHDLLWLSAELEKLE